MKIKSFILIYCLLLTIISCQKSEHENKIPIEDQVQTFEKSDKISITNDLGEAINNAQLLLEVNEKSIWTNASTTGEIIVPKEWVSNARITIKAPNYMTLTLNDQLPSLKKISLKKVPSLPTLNLSGTVSGFDIKDKDGYIDFALITESFTKNTLTQLDFNKIISPLTENISVAGYSIPLPQNIYLPKQKESYFITLVLQKLNFIVNFSDYGQKKLSALSGRFPFKKVLSEVQNKKPYYELVNLFEMKSTSEVSFDFNSINLSKDIQLNKVNSPEKKLITAPNYNSDQVMIALNCLKTDSSIAPLDIKKVNSGETVELKSQAGNNLLFAGIIKNKADFESSNENMERISVVILPW
ncbi:MAG: hypothetical protein L6Q37_17470, partial [Bdellovibrionaceae bacterium]|nr:hypothetical protein [Pseudobdellovibrionaceae bacterium]